MNKIFKSKIFYLIIFLLFSVYFLGPEKVLGFVFGSESNVVQWIRENTIIRLRTETDDVRVGTSNTLFIDTGENKLGVGTDAPSSTLSVIGNSFVSGVSTTTTQYINNLTTNYLPYASTSGKIADSGLYWDNLNNRLGVGTIIPAHTLDVNGRAKISTGTLPASTYGFEIAGDLPNPGGSSTEIGMKIGFTTTGSANSKLIGLSTTLDAGFTGGRATMGMIVTNNTQGTMSTLYSVNGNAGYRSRAWGVTTGANIGAAGEAAYGNKNLGLYGNAIVNKNSALNIGVMGFAANTGTSPTVVGGYFGLHQSADPTFVSSALIADNGAYTAPIFIGRDNGTEVFRIADGGNLGVGTTAPAGKLHIQDPDYADTALFERNGQTVNSARATFRVKTTKTTDMTQGFGPGMIFCMQDNAGVENCNVELNATRGDDDTTGDFAIRTYNTGVASDVLFVQGSTGNVGIGTTTPTAVLHLKAGTATANTAPLKFTIGTLLDTPEDGAVEYDGTNLYITSSSTRKTITTSTGGSANKASCWKADGTLGYCSDAVGVDGSCTCN
jgi:hypothetical protein